MKKISFILLLAAFTFIFQNCGSSKGKNEISGTGTGTATGVGTGTGTGTGTATGTGIGTGTGLGTGTTSAAPQCKEKSQGKCKEIVDCVNKNCQGKTENCDQCLKSANCADKKLSKDFSSCLQNKCIQGECKGKDSSCYSGCLEKNCSTTALRCFWDYSKAKGKKGCGETLTCFSSCDKKTSKTEKDKCNEKCVENLDPKGQELFLETAVCMDKAKSDKNEGAQCIGLILSCTSNNTSGNKDCNEVLKCSLSCNLKDQDESLKCMGKCFSEGTKDAQKGFVTVSKYCFEPNGQGFGKAACLDGMKTCNKPAGKTSCADTLKCVTSCKGSAYCPFECVGKASPSSFTRFSSFMTCYSKNCGHCKDDACNTSCVPKHCLNEYMACN